MAGRPRTRIDDDAPPAATPFLKWAGGKTSIANEILKHLPDDLTARTYREPFVGGGAMFFHVKTHRQPAHVVLSDALADLMITYEIVREHVEPLITRLKELRKQHSEEHYYAIRKRFNEEREAPKVERAAWLIYLNKTCYNGLYRTNQAGEFNVPMGRYQNPNVADERRLRMASIALDEVETKCARFEALLDDAKEGDVIYLDPPYVPISDTAYFAAYSDGGFGPDDQKRLAEVYRKLDERGCLLALSNSNTEKVHELYDGYGFEMKEIFAPRAISAKASTRGEVSELLIRNVKRYPKKG